LADYLIQELKLAALKDREAERFYALDSMVSGSERLRRAAAELVRRHSALNAPNADAAPSYRAWQQTYEAYEVWVSAVIAAIEVGAEPRAWWVEESKVSALRAAKETQKLHKLLGSTPEDVLQMLQVAQAAVDEEAWSP